MDRIIDAAAVVFAEQGYEAATMEAIASGAETSIGSIYQFFPNKLAVFNELARRYHDKLRVVFDGLVSGPLLERPWDEILESGLDALAAFHESDPGFRAVWVGLHLTEQVVSEGEAINKEFAHRLEAIMELKLPNLPASMRPVAATMMVEVCTAMLIVAARRPLEAQALMAETKALLRRYLAPYHTDAERSGRGEGKPLRKTARGALRSKR